MTKAAERAAVVAEARTWLGTPYHHAADVKGVGVDCAMILLRVFADLGLTEDFDPRPYTPDWHLHRSEEIYLGALQDRMIEVSSPLPGDIVIWRHGRTYSHAGIVSAWPFVIHAYHQSRMVEETDVTGTPLMANNRPHKFFSYWGR